MHIIDDLFTFVNIHEQCGQPLVWYMCEHSLSCVHDCDVVLQLTKTIVGLQTVLFKLMFFVVLRFWLFLCPWVGCKILWWVCLSVCLSLSVDSHNLKAASLNFTKFWCMLPVAVAWSPSDGFEICYVLLVLWMTSYFNTMRPIGQTQARRFLV